MANKLVRDRIPKIISESGRTPLTHILADDTELETELWRKLDEEIAELRDAKDINELADVMEVVYALADFYGVPINELEEVRRNKAYERGTFSKKIYLDGIE
ncbi:MAG: nucleoside triphosphate pyrophosphohydrolase [archaeon]